MRAVSPIFAPNVAITGAADQGFCVTPHQSPVRTGTGRCAGKLLRHVDFALPPLPSDHRGEVGAEPHLLAVVPAETGDETAAAPEQIVGHADHARIRPGLWADLADMGEDPVRLNLRPRFA